MLRLGGNGEERKVVEARRDSAGRIAARLKLGEHRPRTRDDRWGKSGELCDGDSVAAVGSAIGHFVEKDQVTLPFARADVVQRQRVEAASEPGKLVIVGRE